MSDGMELTSISLVLTSYLPVEYQENAAKCWIQYFSFPGLIT